MKHDTCFKHTRFGLDKPLHPVNREKCQAWKDFCSNAELANDISNILKSLEGMYIRDMSLLKDKIDSNFNPKEAVKILLKTHFPYQLECQGQEQLEPEQVQECSGQVAVGLDMVTEDFLEYITTEKVRNAMRSFGSRKVPGPDGFKPIVLKNLNEKAVIFLTELYKMSMEACHSSCKLGEVKS